MDLRLGAVNLFCVILLTTAQILRSEAKAVNNAPVCQSELCKDIATEIIDGMVETVDPCEDFYSYICGNWGKKALTQKKKNRWSQFNIVSNRTIYQLHEILNSGLNPLENVAVQKAKQLYQACTDENAIEIKGLKMLIDLLWKEGGWPLAMNLPAWLLRQKPWQKIEANFNKILGASPFYKIQVLADVQNSDNHILMITFPEDKPVLSTSSAIPISPSDYLKLPEVINYKRVLMEIATIFIHNTGGVVTLTDLEADAEDIITFELYLQTLRVSNATKKFTLADIYKKLTISELQNDYDKQGGKTPNAQINWLSRIQHLFSDIPDIHIDGSEEIVLSPVNYVQKLPGLLDKVPPRTIVNTIYWWVIKTLGPYANEEIASLLQQLLPKALRPPVPPERWVVCTAQNELQHAVAYAYVQKHFPNVSKDRAVEMVKKIAEEMGDEIQNSKWLDSYSKNNALEKLAAMKEFVGFPDWYADDKAVMERYKDLDVGRFHLENNLAIRQFILQQQLKLLRKPADKNEFFGSPIMVNAFYYFPGNSLTIPAAITQIPFFNDHQPDALNFGGIGSVIGHEISHGFDDVGRQFDKDGNMKEWWSSNTLQEYINRTECFINKFHKYAIVHNKTVYRLDARATLSENIADSTGVRAAFRAFEKHSTQPTSNNLRLPGLEKFNSKQLFFVAFAHSFCEAVTLEAQLNQMRTDTHSPSAFRITGTLSNMEQFAQAFSCPAGSTMNPKDRCGIWY